MTATARTFAATSAGEGLEVASSSPSLSSSVASEVREDFYTLENVEEGEAEEEGDGVGQLLIATVEELESEEEGEAKEEGDGVGQLLRATVEELEGALEDTRQLLLSRDTELWQLKSELDRYRQQAAREIANKTRLAQALDQSQSHTSQLEDFLQGWQLELQDYKVKNKRLQAALQAEQGKAQKFESRVIVAQEKDGQIEALKSELEDCKMLLSQQLSDNQPTRTLGSPTFPIDIAQQQFLKQAIFHLLTDFHAEEQLRAIISILDFSAQERMAVYRKRQEKGGLYK